MAKPLQITVFVVTFLIALFLGLVFETGYYQASIHATETLGGKPLPFLSQLIAQNYRGITHVMLTPWLGFIGIYLLTKHREEKGADLFLLSFAAFAAIETLLTLFLLIFLLLPFAPVYLLSDFRSSTIVEWAIAIGFWISVILILVFGLRRRKQDR